MKPRIIIHGGAGNITPQNLPKASYQAYRAALISILNEANDILAIPSASALDVATHAVSLLENNPLFNAGHGAVFTTAGTHELEASVMCSKGYVKRGCGVMKVTRAKNPILLAKEMLKKGNNVYGGGAQGHCQLEGESCDKLAKDWGLERVKPSYYWTRRRWDEHRRGLELPYDDETYREHRQRIDEGLEGETDVLSPSQATGLVSEDDLYVGDISWDGKEYLPQGTVGAVVLDGSGMACVATSTGGLTNKLPGRIGDTPTLGAGFWAEEWDTTHMSYSGAFAQPASASSNPLAGLANVVGDCIPGFSSYVGLPDADVEDQAGRIVHNTRCVAMSGTGNGDSFLRLAAVRTAAAIAQYSANLPLHHGTYPLQAAVTAVAGPNGKLRRSAEDRWRITGEGEGGIIGIDYQPERGPLVVADFNCGGMFRAWIDDRDEAQMAVFRQYTFDEADLL